MLRWFCHVERMEEERLARKVCELDVRGTRKRRSRRGWMGSIKGQCFAYKGRRYPERERERGDAYIMAMNSTMYVWV